MCTALHSVYNTFPERDKTSAGGGLSLGVTSVSGIWDRPRGSHPPRPRARLANEEIKVKWLNKRTPNGEGRAGTGTQSPPGSEKRPSLHLEALNVTPVVAGWSPGLQSLTPGQVRILPSQLLRNSASQGPCTRLAVQDGHERPCVTRPSPGCATRTSTGPRPQNSASVETVVWKMEWYESVSMTQCQ